jgi:predicted ATPase
MTPPPPRLNKPCRIVLTGGPGAGKTTAADLFRRELGELVVIVPESATMLFSGGMPRCHKIQGITATQTAIFHVQRALEDIQFREFSDRILLCDRGTVDGAAYWPGQPEEFFSEVGTTLMDELRRYDAVIYFESAAVGGISIEGGNPTRVESLEQAIALDKKLRELWSRHPKFRFVPHHPSFLQKITFGLNSIQEIVQEILAEQAE